MSRDADFNPYPDEPLRAERPDAPLRGGERIVRREPAMVAPYMPGNDSLGAGKQSNPKDMVGSKKLPLSVLPFRVLIGVALAMLEGMVKYGRHNYRGVGVRASVYFDACQRHMMAWWEGEDMDPDSRLSHIDKAIASLVVLRDSMIQGNWTDDRPPRGNIDMVTANAEAKRIIEQHADKAPYHWTIGDKP